MWRDKLADCGVDEAVKALKDNGMTVTGLCRGGMFPANNDAGRQAALDENRRAVDEAAAIDAQCLVMVCGGLPDGSRDMVDARKQIADGLAMMLPHARDADLAVAIEPLHPMTAADRACVNGEAVTVVSARGGQSDQPAPARAAPRGRPLASRPLGVCCITSISP